MWCGTYKWCQRCVLDQQHSLFLHVCVCACVYMRRCVFMCVFHCELIDGFYVFRAVNIHICQEWESQINEKTQSRHWSALARRVKKRDSMWLVDDAHNRYEVIYWVLFDDYDAKQNFHIFLLLHLIKLLFIVPQCVKYGTYKLMNIHDTLYGKYEKTGTKWKKAKSNTKKRYHLFFFRCMFAP